MDILLYIYFGIVVLSVLSLLGMYIPKKQIYNVISIVVAIVIILLMSYINFTSVPSNYIAPKILSVILAILPLIPVILFFVKKIGMKGLKIYISIILIISIISQIYTVISFIGSFIYWIIRNAPEVFTEFLNGN